MTLVTRPISPAPTSHHELSITIVTAMMPSAQRIVIVQ